MSGYSKRSDRLPTRGTKSRNYIFYSNIHLLLAYRARIETFGLFCYDIYMDEIKQLLGPFPEVTNLNGKTIEQVDCGSYIREKISYGVETGERVTAYVCIPKGLTSATPAIFCHHQHHGQFDIGKSEVVGLTGDPDQAYASELAEKGYITFSPDAIAFEERNWATPGSSEYYELS